ncbi:NADH-quinone oxidoreductase subunit NuoE [Nitrospira moscoviensis]|uniref:NADH-quinone oxidoreductase, subunit E n=1 Tax=Nitrospira moscoviensis TaxID=42253 RepID=A0A0K2GE14_NITMO|nr:NADH-quinone oxidoreductase subunit NuoE [Nitrospira moscoviensis]ALA59188.1 NADH-quinone oxidoreductase, subunit E [Nitrospira moscoviensis]
MLSDIERREIENELAHYPDKRAACVEALKVVQQHRSWVSDESLRDVAALLGMTPDELDGVATFYNLIFRKPVGRHVILVCNSVSCWLTGYDRVRGRLEERLGVRFGQTTSDGRFTLLPIVCLGACDHAPVMMIDRDTHGNLTPDGVEEILKKYT